LPGESMMWAARAGLNPRLCLQELPGGLVVGPSVGRWLGWEDPVRTGDIADRIDREHT
jgi:hypothetical protein